jgi:ABC-2 type transport system permease protein
VTATLRKWKAIFGIYFQDALAYRASAVIWITTDLVTAVTMPLVWAHAAGAGMIQGFTTGDFVLYYLCMILVSSFVTSHIMWEIAMEIKEGQFSTALMRPISFYQLTFFRSLSWRVMRTVLFAPMFLALLFLYRGYLEGATVYLGWEVFAAIVLGHLVSFTFVMMMSLLALFFQEVTSVFELYYIPMLFLSGQIFPIAVLPEWARTLSLFFPFYFTVGAPTEMLIGRIPPDRIPGILGIQLVWIVVCYVVSKFLWRKGLKYYTGVGM